MVGIDCTPNRLCSLGDSSTLTFTSFIRPAKSAASSASTGLTMRHGPHQGAHRSTTTGTDACSAISAKVSSPASTIHGSGRWQLPQCGVPLAVAGTRFLRPQFGHVMTAPSAMGRASLSARGGLRAILITDCQFRFFQVDLDDRAIADVPGQQGAPDPRLDFPGDE